MNEEKEVDIEKSENSADMCFLHKICQREGKGVFLHSFIAVSCLDPQSQICETGSYLCMALLTCMR